MSVQTSQRTLRLGDTGSDVRRLQEALNANGFGQLVKDGVFGVETEEAVLRCQHYYGLVEDGIVGPDTWSYL